MMSRLTHWRLQFSVIKDLNKQFAQNEKSNSKNYVAWLLIAISIGMFLICSENIIPKNLLAKSIWSCELNLPLIEFRFHIWETEMCVCCELQKENTYMNTCKRTVCIQGVPSISIHFCCPVARPVSTRAHRSASLIKRTLQELPMRGWVTRSDNFGARYERFSKKCIFWVILERI